MIRELSLKPDFAKTIERFEAWWLGELIDRPPITAYVRCDRSARDVPAPPTLQQRWTNIDYVIESAVARLESMHFVADTLPVFVPNLGPEITATLFDCALAFGKDTSWSSPVVETIDDWQQIIHRGPDLDATYWQLIERMTDRAIEVGRGKFLVGITDLHGNFDILAALRDPQTLCTDLIDCPETVRRAGDVAARAYVDCFDRLYAKLAAAQMGSTTWCGIYHEGPAYVPSCDFWCLVSREVARDLIVPDIITEMKPQERSIFHLDGPAALRHLDLVLDLPGLNAVQWVYGDGHGPAANWIDVYRRIRDAGKSVHVLAADAQDALAVLDALGPKGLWIQVLREFDTREEAESFERCVEMR